MAVALVCSSGFEALAQVMAVEALLMPVRYFRRIVSIGESRGAR
jgi:hypothetical protein